MGETKKLKLIVEHSKDINEIELNLYNIDTVFNILDYGAEKDGKTFYINYDNDNIDDNFNTLCEIIFDFGYKKLNDANGFDYSDLNKIQDYFEKVMRNIEDYCNDNQDKEKFAKKFVNKLIEIINNKYGFGDKNFQINLEGLSFEEYYIELSGVLTNVIMNSKKFTSKNSKFSQKKDIQNKDPEEMTTEDFEYLIENNKDRINDKLIKTLIEKLDSENISLMSRENKIEASYFAISYFDDIELFKKYYNSVLESSENSYHTESYNNNCIKQFYTRGKINIVEALDFMEINEENFSNLLNEELIKINTVDLKLLNNILSKYFDLNSNIKDNFKYPAEIIEQGLKVEGQGSNQIVINKREIKYDKTKTPWVILEIKDRIFSCLNNNESDLLYEVIYKNDNTQKITYYDKLGVPLAIAKINEKEELEFEQEFENKKAYYDSDKIKEILNDDYVSINQFDHKLSFLTHALLNNRKNIVFKTNCKTAKEIANVIEKSQNNEEKDKTFICDYSVDDEHNVQVFVKNGCVDILDCLFHGNQEINDEIKNECEKRRLQNTEINQISLIMQQPFNCVEASKLFATVLAKEYSEYYGNLDGFSEKLNRFKEFMEKVTIGIEDEKQVDYVKESYKNDEFRKENIEMLKIILKTSNELLEEYKIHFVMPIPYIDLFCKTIRNIDNVFDNEMKEVYNIFSIINSRNVISRSLEELQNKKDKSDKYKQFIGDIIRFNKINFSEKEKDENLINKLDRAGELLEFVKNGITGFNEFNEQQKEIFENIDKKISSGEENILEECLEEFGKLQTNKIDFK